MKILYGICSEGLGHATRALALGAYLLVQGHDVQFVAQGDAGAMLREQFPGRVTDRIAVGRPDFVLNDFDRATTLFALARQVPMLAIDNLHALVRCENDLPPDELFLRLCRTRVGTHACHYCVPSLVPRRVLPPYAATTRVHLPLLRREVFEAEPVLGPDVVVYFNDSADHERIAGVLAQTSATYQFFGTPNSGRRGNIVHESLSGSCFLQALASARAVIGGAGHQLLAESVALGKPVLAVMSPGHGEQAQNAHDLVAAGWGLSTGDLDVATVENFLSRSFQMPAIRRDRNRELLESLDRALGGQNAASPEHA